MLTNETLSVRDAVETYLNATGSSPSLAHQILAELHEPGAQSLDLLGDTLPYHIEDGRRVVSRARFDALMAHISGRSTLKRGSSPQQFEGADNDERPS
jgi:hypothetical protein